MAHAFSFDDQEVFARLSGDYNPIHVDRLAARRLMFGRLVVHGVHVVLWALDRWCENQAENVRLNSLKVKFRAPIVVDEPVDLATDSPIPGAAKIVVTANRHKLLTADFSYQARTESGLPVPREIPARGPCRDQSAAELGNLSGRLPICLETQSASRMFPNALRRLAGDQLAVLLATSRLVGMEAPGLHSIFNGLDLKASDEPGEPELTYWSEGYDERVSLLTLRIAAPGLCGLLSAFVRPAPKEQATVATIEAIVRPGEFLGERALVIGGSRGLGEVAVKELAAGGAHVKFSYHRGEVEANRVVSEVVAGGHRAECFCHDVLADAATFKARVGDWSPTLLCYFATPFIFTAVKGRFSAERFLDFCDYYVRGFLNTFEAARDLGNELRYVLCPSTSAIDELPMNLGEYSAAKSAAEVLCQFLQKSHPVLRISCPRLPRLPTDQTASLLPVDTRDSAEAVLAALREMRAAPERTSLS